MTGHGISGALQNSSLDYLLCGAAGAAPWSAILIQTTYRLRWFVSIPLAVLLSWMAFIMFFMSYGMISNNWL
jgi:hypothetical protein